MREYILFESDCTITIDQLREETTDLGERRTKKREIKVLLVMQIFERFVNSCAPEQRRKRSAYTPASISQESPHVSAKRAPLNPSTISRQIPTNRSTGRSTLSSSADDTLETKRAARTFPEASKSSHYIFDTFEEIDRC